MLTSLIFILAHDAHAGKLADGWRGRPWGDATSLATAPFPEGCVANPEPGVAWTCQEDVGGIVYPVAYMVSEGYYTGLVLHCDGFAACASLQSVLVAAWGTCRKDEYASGALPDCRWGDSGVFASWDFNRYSDKGTVVAIHVASFRAAEAKEKAKAAGAASGL